MNRVTKIVLGVTTLSVLATSAFAFSCENKEQACDYKGQTCNKMMKIKHHKKAHHGIMDTFMSLDLTKTQRKEIISIMKEAKESIEKPSKAFSASEFNKAQFIKLVKEQKAAKIVKKAETIEKIYAVLNKNQKKELKVLLDQKAQFKGGKYCDKNCNGRG